MAEKKKKVYEKARDWTIIVYPDSAPSNWRDILNDTYLIFQSANGGNLNDYLKFYIEKYNKHFSEEIVQNIIKQMSEAIKFLHDSHIIFRNLSLENTYIDFENENDLEDFDLLKANIKISNFHFAKILDDNELTHSFIGVPAYMDPNILLKPQDQIAYEYKADIWSLGCICYELLNGVTPFDGEDFDDLLKNIKKATYKIPSELKLSKETISFINGMLQFDPSKRFDINDVINHDFLNKKVSEFTYTDYEKLGKVEDNGIVLDIKFN